MNRGLDLVGADSGGLVSSLFQAGGGVIDYAKQSQKDKDQSASDNVKLSAALAADKAATSAVATASVSAALVKKDPSKLNVAKADQMAADSAVKAQDKAGAQVPDNLKSKRVDAAQSAVDGSTVNLQDATRSGDSTKILIAQSQLDAANKTLAKAQGGGDSGGSKASEGEDGGKAPASFFSRSIVGPVKVWMGLVGAVVIGGVIYWRRK